MCMVSMMEDYGRTRILPTTWTPDTFNEYQEILRRLEELDKKLNQPDCQDPAKGKWMKAVERRLKKLEKQAKQNASV